MARQNIQFGAVLGHRAARDGNAALSQNFDDLLVAQRRAARLVLHQIKDGFFHACVAHRFARSSLISGREKVFHLENTLRAGHVFSGHGAADRGLVHANRIGDVPHGHRLQMRWAVLKEIPLPRNDLVRDIGNRLLALVDRSDQEFAAPDFVADVIFDFSAVAVLRDNVLVDIADP